MRWKDINATAGKDRTKVVCFIVRPVKISISLSFEKLKQMMPVCIETPQTGRRFQMIVC